MASCGQACGILPGALTMVVSQSQAPDRGGDEIFPRIVCSAPSAGPRRSTSSESSLDPNHLVDILPGTAASAGRQRLRAVIRGFIIAMIVGINAVIVCAVWQNELAKDRIKGWGRSSLIRASSVLGIKQHSVDTTSAEPNSKSLDQAVIPTPSSISEILELQLQVQTAVGDLALLQRIVEQVASKQEQLSRDIATLQATEQNISEKISSFSKIATVRSVPPKNVAKLVHSKIPKQATASPLPLATPSAPRDVQFAPSTRNELSSER